MLQRIRKALGNKTYLPNRKTNASLMMDEVFDSYVGEKAKFKASTRECKRLGVSLRTWWNLQRMGRVTAITAWLFGFLSVMLKLMGLSKTVFEVTQKEHNSRDGDDKIVVTVSSSDLTYVVVGLYGSAAEDMLTRIILDDRGWKSVICSPDPPTFLENGESDCYNSMVIRVLSVMLKLMGLSKTVFEVTQKEHNSNDGDDKNVGECKRLGVSLRTWWNLQRMGRVTAITAWLFGFLSVMLKLMGLSKTVFEVTQKEHNSRDGDDKIVGRFTYDKSPMIIPGVVILLP
ncbi:hypothetical protein L1987_78463 [Smallanthus sonchifolius]|uniref:Uncharacterized protein n=1 Tax=Smallanthus sonchifolius TaxID=185202 RepID=A0ACB8ZCK5_9ASTR|nr:hypothetical protein L1987_78463 [Smallanthus sonchifolius]